MCTVILCRRPDRPWPLILAANRDEMRDRPWQQPARHWPERPHVRAGLDELAGGSWLGVNDSGVVATVLDRPGSLGPAAGKRTRGELVLESLDHADAADAADALLDVNPQAYRPFNLVIADNRDAYLLTGDGRTVRRHPIAAGVSMVTSGSLNDLSNPRIRRFLPLFRDAASPRPGSAGWQDWQNLLASPAAPDDPPHAGLCFQMATGYGTGSAALIALPAVDQSAEVPVFDFCDGPPDGGQWRPVLY